VHMETMNPSRNQLSLSVSNSIANVCGEVFLDLTVVKI
jgi:hypothetical protein